MKQLMATAWNAHMEKVTVCARSIALGTGQIVVQTVGTKNFRSPCLLLALVQHVQSMMALRLLAAQEKASARATQTVPDISRCALLCVRKQPQERGSKLWRSRGQGRRAQCHRTVLQVKASVLPT